MFSYRYRGRHRRPVEHRRAAAFALSGAAFGLPLALTPAAHAAAPADILDAIAQCESSGNPQASNGDHFGLFQFDLATYASVGGVGNPMDASPATQRAAAERLFELRGTQPWDASAPCWSGKSATAAPSQVVPRHAAYVPRHAAPGRAAPRHAAPYAPRHAAAVTVVAGDTLSGIATSHATTWPQVAAANPQISDPNMITIGERIALP